ncbi:calcium-binding EF hand family [Micractinium conductrix]|uniref:Calcium-binding EF hand family n=1 Tax=Micractinium conductrix TaxID=554055 RepID=A0A2P6VB73_9CHLO|nr:calcium-binding EF hand family [Micractinium conductrix]|eukprot:PSC71340.1 calcium-binding EF hand family [Micractinium conductrix]
MRRGAVVALLVLACLLSEAAASSRLFSSQGSQPLKRTVGKRRPGKDGRLHYKEVDAEHLGRAAFDPHYGLDEELEAEDIGYDEHDIHHATPTVVESRLKQLFPVIDFNKNGVISAQELQHHLYSNGLTISRRRADSEFEDIDFNKDGKVTAAEYLAQVLDDPEERARVEAAGSKLPDPVDYSSFVDTACVEMHVADRNGDGGLNEEEFFDFLNPEEGDNIPLKLQCLRQDIYKHLYEGTEEDGHTPRPKPPPGAPLNMTFDQFYDQMWSQFTVWDGHEEGDGKMWTEEKEKQQARRKFVLLDSNSDAHLTAEELLPVFADLHPTESRYARMQAEHMMDMAECKDDRLTLDLMLSVPHAFYGVIQAHHDELHATTYSTQGRPWMARAGGHPLAAIGGGLTTAAAGANPAASGAIPVPRFSQQPRQQQQKHSSLPMQHQQQQQNHQHYQQQQQQQQAMHAVQLSQPCPHIPHPPPRNFQLSQPPLALSQPLMPVSQPHGGFAPWSQADTVMTGLGEEHTVGDNMYAEQRCFEAHQGGTQAVGSAPHPHPAAADVDQRRPASQAAARLLQDMARKGGPSAEEHAALAGLGPKLEVVEGQQQALATALVGLQADVTGQGATLQDVGKACTDLLQVVRSIAGASGSIDQRLLALLARQAPPPPPVTGDMAVQTSPFVASPPVVVALAPPPASFDMAVQTSPLADVAPVAAAAAALPSPAAAPVLRPTAAAVSALPGTVGALRAIPQRRPGSASSQPLPATKPTMPPAAAASRRGLAGPAAAAPEAATAPAAPTFRAAPPPAAATFCAAPPPAKPTTSVVPAGPAEPQRRTTRLAEPQPQSARKQQQEKRATSAAAPAGVALGTAGSKGEQWDVEASPTAPAAAPLRGQASFGRKRPVRAQPQQLASGSAAAAGRPPPAKKARKQAPASQPPSATKPARQPAPASQPPSTAIRASQQVPASQAESLFDMFMLGEAEEEAAAPAPAARQPQRPAAPPAAAAPRAGSIASAGDCGDDLAEKVRRQRARHQQRVAAVMAAARR